MDYGTYLWAKLGVLALLAFVYGALFGPNATKWRQERRARKELRSPRASDR